MHRILAVFAAVVLVLAAQLAQINLTPVRALAAGPTHREIAPAGRPSLVKAELTGTPPAAKAHQLHNALPADVQQLEAAKKRAAQVEEPVAGAKAAAVPNPRGSLDTVKAAGGTPKRSYAMLPSSSTTGPVSPQAAVYRGLIGNGISAVEAGGYVPPDTTGSIRPNNYIEMVNSRIAVYDRALTLLGATSTDQLANLPGCFNGDPQIDWDVAGNRRFYVLLIEQCSIAGLTQNGLAIGWSRTADPTPNSLAGPSSTSGWCKFVLPTGTFLNDYPKLGHSDGWLVVGSNLFGATGNLLTANVLAISKPANADSSCSAPASTFSYGSAATPS
jgi:hypothetical protein